jgi:hypothetical protein
LARWLAAYKTQRKLVSVHDPRKKGKHRDMALGFAQRVKVGVGVGDLWRGSGVIRVWSYLTLSKL